MSEEQWQEGKMVVVTWLITFIEHTLIIIDGWTLVIDSCLNTKSMNIGHTLIDTRL
jgi:hypothetical protein